MSIIITVHANGWEVRNDGHVGQTRVFNSRDEFLLDVYRRTCDWHTSDRVVIVQEEGKTQP